MTFKPAFSGTLHRQQRGLGAIAAIVVLVLLAGLAAAVVRLGSASAGASAQEIESSRAVHAARAGLQWGLFQAFKGSWTSCNGNVQSLDLRSATGMTVTLRCDSTAYNEGETSPGVPQVVRVFTIEAVACNAAVACPDAARVASPGYVERMLRVQAVN